MTNHITDKQIEGFKKNGALLLKGVFKDHVESIRAAIEENKANPSCVNAPTDPMTAVHLFSKTTSYGTNLMAIVLW